MKTLSFFLAFVAVLCASTLGACAVIAGSGLLAYFAALAILSAALGLLAALTHDADNAAIAAYHENHARVARALAR